MTGNSHEIDKEPFRYSSDSIFPSDLEILLPNSKEIYQRLRNGVHITSLIDGGAPLYRELQKSENSYAQVFAIFGYNLIHDPSGFFYFNSDEDRSQALLSATKKAALVIYTLFVYLEDQNLDPSYAIREQPIAWASILASHSHHMELFRDAEIPDEPTLKKSVNWLKDRGFCLVNGGNIQFLPPVERFLRSVEQWASSLEENVKEGESL